MMMIIIVINRNWKITQ